MISKIEADLPQLTVNDDVTTDRTIVVDLPHISDENGPFRLDSACSGNVLYVTTTPIICRYLYIIVAVNNSVIMNVQSVSTKDLLEQSIKSSPLYYVAAVVYASQYMPGFRMRYVLGAGDNTTDHNGHTFHNRAVKDDYQYFFRVFSNDSTPEV